MLMFDGTDALVQGFVSLDRDFSASFMASLIWCCDGDNLPNVDSAIRSTAR
jgi:hypothetical protein